MKRRAVAAVAGLAVLGLGASLSATSADAASGAQRILILSTSTTGNPTVIANGAIHARGVDVVVNDNRDRLVFPRGSISVVHSSTFTRETFDKVTCLARSVERGTWKVTAGTRAYDDAAGRGTYSAEVLAVGCNRALPPRLIQLRISAVGTVRY